MTQILTFPNVTGTGTTHIGGIARDPHTGFYMILTDPAAAWATEGADLTGDHLLIKYNPLTSCTLWTMNLTTVTHEKYGGFQDVETDRRGNTYVVGTFPGTILLVDKYGREIKGWYLPSPFPTPVPGVPFTKRGFGGLAAVPGTNICYDPIGDHLCKQLGRLIRAAPGERPWRRRCRPGCCITIPTPFICRLNMAGKKKWERAEYLGTVAVEYPVDEEFPQGGVPVAVTQIGPESLYVILAFGDFPWVERAGGRRRFPMPDITREVEALLRK
ncbi:hypothetical protein B0T09DRAFT_367567 [Sordaria sp. MPI-SDFR-AT-0083]|nr:hypothetical protein B0T09DRAFT_367567 [Sordaria sp. MPI-SDFR-AT-0083]